MSAGIPEQESFEEEALGRAYDTRLLLRLWPYVRPFWRQIALTLMLFVPIFALELTPAWIVKSGIDQVALHAGLETVDAAASSASPSFSSSPRFSRRSRNSSTTRVASRSAR